MQCPVQHALVYQGIFSSTLHGSVVVTINQVHDRTLVADGLNSHFTHALRNNNDRGMTRKAREVCDRATMIAVRCRDDDRALCIRTFPERAVDRPRRAESFESR